MWYKSFLINRVVSDLVNSVRLDVHCTLLVVLLLCACNVWFYHFPVILQIWCGTLHCPRKRIVTIIIRVIGRSPQLRLRGLKMCNLYFAHSRFNFGKILSCFPTLSIEPLYRWIFSVLRRIVSSVYCLSVVQERTSFIRILIYVVVTRNIEDESYFTLTALGSQLTSGCLTSACCPRGTHRHHPWAI